MDTKNCIEVPKKLKTITGKDRDSILIKLREFKKDHFVVNEKWCSDNILLVFYWED